MSASNANPPIPGVPSPTPATTPAAAAANAAPPAVAYASQDAMVRGKVDGVDRDFKVGDLLRTAQMQSAAEARLQQANRAYQENRGAIDFAGQIDQLMRTNPQQARALLESRYGTKLGAEKQEQDDGVTDPAMRALSGELAAIKQQYESLAGTLNQVVGDKTAAAHRAQVQQVINGYPLFKANPELAEVASVLGVALLSNPMQGANGPITLQDAVGEVHAKIANAITLHQQQQHDMRTGHMETLRGLPAQTGTPEMTLPEVPEIPAGAWRDGSWKKYMSGAFQRAVRSV